MPRGAIHDGPGGKTGNIVGYGVVCVGIPIGDPAFVTRLLELKEGEIFDKIDRTFELFGPSQSFTGLQLARACLNPMMDYLGRGMDATAYTLPSFMRFDAKMLNAVAILIGQGEEWPTWHGPPRKRRVGASEGEAQDSQETWRAGPRRCNVKMPRGKSRLRY